MTRRRRDRLEEILPSEQPDMDVPDTYVEDRVPPESPPGLDPLDTPIIADSPRRAQSAGRFGNPLKQKMAAQPENSDSLADDESMEPIEEWVARETNFPDAFDLGLSQTTPRRRRRDEE